jgi:glutamate dehydrogenase/leucine dehydrogenase
MLDETDVQERMDSQMKKTYHKIIQTSKMYSCTLREACYIIYALQKIDNVYKATGM